MKFLVMLSVLVIQCAATKSWNGDSYSEETFSVFGWIGYLKRLSLIVLMFSGVVLYYVPESRPHARRICYALIDFTANSLKSALSARESEYMYEKIKSKYYRAKYEQSLIAQRRHSQIQEGDENFVTQSRGKKASFINEDGLLGGREKKSVSRKQSKDYRLSRHHRSSIIKDSSPASGMEVTKPIYLYSDKLDDLQKYTKASPSDAKHANEEAVENYALLISGTPQQMAMLDHKYEKNNVVIVQDPYLRVEYKECGTSTDNLSSKADASGSEHEGPTRDHNDHATDSGMETYVKDVDLCSIPESNVLRVSDYKNLYQTSQFQCGGGCCAGNGGSISSGNLNTTRETVNSASPDTKNVLKSSKSLLNSKTHKKLEGNGGSSFVNYDTLNNSRLRKSSTLTCNRKVEFREEDEEASPVVDHPLNLMCTTLQKKREKTACQQENTSRYVRRKKPRNGESLTRFCCSDASYFTDRGGEADDENSQHGYGATTKLDLNEKPQKENYLFGRNSEDSIFDFYDDVCEEALMKNRLKPALLRAVNWIFGGCSEPSKRAALKHDVGKEEIQRYTDEWLH